MRLSDFTRTDICGDSGCTADAVVIVWRARSAGLEGRVGPRCEWCANARWAKQHGYEHRPIPKPPRQEAML